MFFLNICSEKGIFYQAQPWPVARGVTRNFDYKTYYRLENSVSLYLNIVNFN